MKISARLSIRVSAGWAARQLHNVRVGHVRRPAQQQPLLRLLRGQHQCGAGRRARRAQEGLLQGERRRLLREQDRGGRRGV